MATPLRTLTAAQAAELTGGTLQDCPAGFVLQAVRTLGEAGPGDLSFLHNPKYLALARESRAGLLLVNDPAPLPGRARLVVKDPYRALASLLHALYGAPPPAGGVHPLASVAADAEIHPEACVMAFASVGSRARIGAHAILHPFVHVGADCAIGEGAVLHPHVTLYHETIVGARTIIHAGAVLGADGFGFAMGAQGHLKVPQIGRVIVGADVEIGANSTVDRAALGATVIEDGVKIDNLVMVAHNAVIGRHSVLVAQSGISGSTTLGPGVIIAGQSGAVGHITLGAGAKVGAKSAVTHDLEPGAFVTGHPARNHRDWLLQQAMIDKLPEFRKQLKELGAKVEALEQAARSKPAVRLRSPVSSLPARKPAPVKNSRPAKKKARAKKK